VDDRLRVDDHLDAVVVDPEQLVGLDDLEALVHQCRGVDRDLRPHRPRRMGQGVVDRDVRQLVAATASERAAAGREHDPGHPLGLPAGVSRQALVHRAVLGVDRHDVARTRLVEHGPDHGPARDERLLVGQRQPLAGRQGGQREPQPGEPHDPVHTHVGHRAELGQSLGAGSDLGAGRHPVVHLGRPRRIADDDHLGAQVAGLGHQRVG
jgi:hypothetical protein